MHSAPPCGIAAGISPSIAEEIGDSWIHGAGTDPQKLARFRALQRLHAGWEAEPTPQRLGFGRRLALVAEHTWGVDIKTYLRDETAWDRADFDAARASDYRFDYTEQSWVEQRAYIDAALNELVAEDRLPVRAADSLRSPCPLPPSRIRARSCKMADGPPTSRPRPATSPRSRRPAAVSLRAPAARCSATATKATTGRRSRPTSTPTSSTAKSGRSSTTTSRGSPTRAQPATLLSHRTTSASPAPRPALPECPMTRTSCWVRPVASMSRSGPSTRTRVELTLVLRDKPANRMPEAGFFSFTPATDGGWSLEKMGLWHRGDAIVRRGGGQLQAVTAVRTTSGAGRRHADRGKDADRRVAAMRDEAAGADRAARRRPRPAPSSAPICATSPRFISGPACRRIASSRAFRAASPSSASRRFLPAHARDRRPA
jgi:hypothetical protein